MQENTKLQIEASEWFEKYYYENEDIEQINEIDGIIEVKYGNEIYKTWKVEFIKPFIIKFLKEINPNSLISPEIDKIDITIFNNKIDKITPVEIQKTSLSLRKFNHTDFERAIRKQVETNIKYFGVCWFFFDSEYLRYLQNNNLSTGSDIDMTWFVKLMQDNTLKAFTIKYDGLVNELTIKDFDYIKLSEYQITLYTNKLKIYRNVVFGYKFNQEEIDKYLNDFNINYDKNKNGLSRHCIKNINDDKCKLYGKILYFIGNLSNINKMLDMNYNFNHDHVKEGAIIFGIFEVVGIHKQANLIKFVDKFDICKYFPGYLRNKEQWESYRNSNLTHETFTMITNGSLKFNKTMLDF